MFFLFFGAQFGTDTVSRIDFEDGSDEQQDHPFVVDVFNVTIVAFGTACAEKREKKIINSVDHEDAGQQEGQISYVHNAFQSAHGGVLSFVGLHGLCDGKHHRSGQEHPAGYGLVPHQHKTADTEHHEYATDCEKYGLQSGHWFHGCSSFCSLNT